VILNQNKLELPKVQWQPTWWQKERW